MGVKGWNRLLAEKGWLPTIDSMDASSSSLWMDLATTLEHSNNHADLSERLVTIPGGSELHLDGFALCFHIHAVAYNRYRNQFFGTGRKRKSVTQIAPWQVRQALPQFLPLEWVQAVTQEFVNELQDQQHMKLLVYWDGELRYGPPQDAVAVASFKHEEELHRQSKRVEEWANLQQYCIHGRLPTEMACWERNFPKNRLFITQVMHTLMSSSSSCQMVFSDEEADSVMARAVTGRPDAYIVGMDSDFCFFPHVNYIPMSTLSVDNSNCQAIVLRRDVLAESLDLPDESSMVDVAILMGNDYVDASLLAKIDLPPHVANVIVQNDRRRASLAASILEYLRAATAVTCLNDPNAQPRLEFVRNLYNLQDMSAYPCQESSVSAEDTTMIPAVHEDLINLSTIAVDPNEGDTNVQDAVVRYLTALVDHQAGSDNKEAFIDMSHVEIFQKLASELSSSSSSSNIKGGTTTDKGNKYSSVDKNAPNKAWRPLWSDVPAVYWIERVTSKVIQNTLRLAIERGDTEAVANIDNPSSVFDAYMFHGMLLAMRGSSNDDDEPEVMEDSEQADNDEKVEEPEAPIGRLKLPVDEFEDEIVSSVRKNRVTIIQGETGCGKSSRIPVMLLNAPSPNPNHAATKMFVSVPRRIAAKALVERLRAVEPEIKDQIALRMGHGVREYETKKTRAWFVTSGYLVRLMANHPEHFDKISILIIDEVHERSVDTDILCLLCRRLLVTNPHLRLVLMSATLAAAMYQDYFGVPEPPIKVGARRFPVREVYLDTLAKEVALHPGDAKKVNSLLLECGKLRGTRTPSAQYLEKVHAVVANLATVLGKPGSSVLIFVPGMTDIISITEHIENIHVPGMTFICVPIHSDIPFEDQMHVFDSANEGEVKIVLGTNACESSVTLPDVDHVICLGLCKQIIYNEASHRQMLMPTWISRASATQRAGRTGRVRPGTVYRFYSRETYETYMDAFEPGEMLRIPLDSVILMLKEMLTDDAITEILQSCLEPPNLSTIERSFESLYSSHFITTPDDSCEITTLGAFVSALGIDLALGSLIGLGIQMGVGAEAIQIAAILSFPKTPWIMSNALIHPTTDFNEQTRKTFVSRCHFDSNLFSEPLAIMNLLHDYEHVAKKKDEWCRSYGIFQPRIRRLATTAENLRKRVADFVGVQEGTLAVTKPPSNMPHGKITVLRVIQVWVFHETVIQLDPKKYQKAVSKKGARIGLQSKSDQIEQEDLHQILMPERHSHTLESSSEIVQKGSFEYFPKDDTGSLGDEFSDRLEKHLISYATEKGAEGAWVAFSDSLSVYYRADSPIIERDLRMIVLGAANYEETTVSARAREGKTKRGIAERACGAYNVVVGDVAENRASGITWLRFRTKGKLKKKKVSDVTKTLSQIAKAYAGRLVSFNFSWPLDSLRGDQSVKFQMNSFGSTNPVAPIDLRDMLGPSLQTSPPKKIFGAQKLLFPDTPNSPFFPKGKTSMIPKQFDRDKPDSSWERPMMECVPEGARLLAVLGSLRRKDHIKLKQQSKPNKEGGEKIGNVNEQEEKVEDNELEIFLEKGNSIAFRWNRFNSNDSVLVDPNSVPASAIPMTGEATMYSLCANTLELRNGGLRAEGLTLLPLGKEFLLLSRLSFGLFDKRNVDNGSIADISVQWAQCGKKRKKLLTERVLKAVEFHQSAIELGEALECFPGKVRDLLAIFDNIDGYESSPWETLHANPFISSNLQRHKKKLEESKTNRYNQRESSAVDDVRATSDAHSNKSITARQATRASALSDSDAKELIQLFDQKAKEKDLSSARFLGMIVKQTRCRLASMPEKSYQHITADWELDKTMKDGQNWYKSIFNSPDLPYITRTSNKYAAWMREDRARKARPMSIAEAKSCIPSSFKSIFRSHCLAIRGPDGGLYFDSLKLAFQVEAAFWLERQFATTKQHWYDQDLRSGLMTSRLCATVAGSRRQTENKNKKTKKKNATK